MKRKWVNNIFKGLCLTSALFVFQACYGTPQDFGQDFYIKGVVKSKKTGEPILGIKVSVGSSYHLGQVVWQLFEETDESGNFSFYHHETDKIYVLFEDVDSTDGNNYARKDTSITVRNSEVILNVELDEK